MEVQGGFKNILNVCLIEALGTGLLLFALNFSGAPSQTDPIAVASAIFIAIVVAAPISGSHFNPAVTLGVFVRETFMN